MATIISLTLSSIAITLSLIVIITQTRRTKKENADAVYHLRLEVCEFVINAWSIYTSIENKTNNDKYDIKEIYELASKYKIKQELLFSGEAREYLDKFLSAFSVYTEKICYKEISNKKLEESAYKQLQTMFETKDADIEMLKKYL